MSKRAETFIKANRELFLEFVAPKISAFAASFIKDLPGIRGKAAQANLTEGDWIDILEFLTCDLIPITLSRTLTLESVIPILKEYVDVDSQSTN